MRGFARNSGGGVSVGSNHVSHEVECSTVSSRSMFCSSQTGTRAASIRVQPDAWSSRRKDAARCVSDRRSGWVSAESIVEVVSSQTIRASLLPHSRTLHTSWSVGSGHRWSRHSTRPSSANGERDRLPWPLPLQCRCLAACGDTPCKMQQWWALSRAVKSVSEKCSRRI